MSTTTEAFIPPIDHEFNAQNQPSCPCGKPTWHGGELCRECFFDWFYSDSVKSVASRGRFDYEDNRSGSCNRCGHAPGNCGCGGR